MKEPKFFHAQEADAGQPSLRAPGSSRAGMGFQWGGMLVRAMKMRQSFTDAANKARLIRLHPGHREELPPQPAVRADVPENFASRPGSRRT